jgi:isoleucyl-tRNA synthetase
MEDFSKLEKEILNFWQKERIFQKSVEQRKGKKPFVFYDGPPFATGRPHYGHLLPSTLKDTALRYWAMKGYYLPRRVGWDCHGLPVENLAEEQLGIKVKPEIEELGVENFNKACRKIVFQDRGAFTTTLQRLGRWADYEDCYSTLDTPYIESVWWVFKQLFKQGLVYKDYRVAPYCPRCGTPLSNFELNQPGGYQEIEDTSVYFLVPLEEEAETFFLVWTTTPWTIPANAGIAVQPKEEYLKVKMNDRFLFLAKEKLSLLEGKDYQVIEELKGKDLLGKRYQPIYLNQPISPADYQIVGADWVSIEEGSGLVHIAPAFGEDDMALGKKHKLSVKITVDEEGKIKNGLGLPGEGKKVWEANEIIIQDLEQKKLLWKEEKVTHNYPFCWRCGQRLIYYPLNNWYIAVKKLQKNLLANNKKIYWVPAYLKDGRFGRWLEEVRDWAVSRNRYWGAPLPIWVSSSETKIIGSRQELGKQKFTTNRYWLLRHPESETNQAGILSTSEDKYPLTLKGKKELEKVLPKLKKQKIDLIFASPVRRTKETAEIVGQALGKKPVYCPELREREIGVFEEKPVSDYRSFFKNKLERVTHSPEKGETGLETKMRMYRFLQKIDRQYKGKNILFISHQGPLRLLLAANQGLTSPETVDAWPSLTFGLAELRTLDFKIFPYNEEGELDFHRPFIDQVYFLSQKGERMKRVESVFDCWFESGAMPYAQNHYPFENKKWTEKNFPADFVCESMDQTRGWFYTLNVLATALTQKNIGLGKHQPAFKNVVVPGLVLSSSGQKLSKHLKNYPDPSVLMEKYGADALRLFFLTSTSLGNNYLVSEENVQQVWRKIISTLWNSYQFYTTYQSKRSFSSPVSKNILDRWIISRLHQVNREVEDKMTNYHLDEAAQLLAEFIDDLSNWYIRHSRSRFQSDFSSEKEQASLTLAFILFRLSLLLAPFAPFISERIYQGLAKEENFPSSVHLNDYPLAEKKAIDSSLMEEMKKTKVIISLGLRLRATAGIKVRQPLAELRIAGQFELDRQLIALIKEALNVKEVNWVKEVKPEDSWAVYQEGEISLGLKTEMTPSLEKEGWAREISRALQTMRKDLSLKPRQIIDIYYQADSPLESFIEQKRAFFLEKNRAAKLEKGNRQRNYAAQKELKIGNYSLWLAINSKK